jgi:triosephosphate isomerase
MSRGIVQLAHWGAYLADVSENEVVAVQPHPLDHDPSPLLANIPGSTTSSARIARPAIRKGWLENGPGATDRRGVDPFVEVEWDRALDLLAPELDRVVTTHGPAAIYGGSYGWASAGRFHHAQSHLKRFLNLLGGFTASFASYSLGASHVILGHSERRADHGESSAMVCAKAVAARAAGLVAVICLGETEAERDAGDTLAVVGAQLRTSVPEGACAADTVIAYEPIWAIGTGRTPTLAQIAEVHDFLRAELVARFGAEGEGMRLLYGGSVKPSNAGEIFATSNVDGALVGGASLKATDFGAILSALDAA